MVSAFEHVVAVLESVGNTVTRTADDTAAATCPAHDDRKASLSIGPRRDGKGVVLCCHVGCAATDVVAAVGLSMADLFDDKYMKMVYKPDVLYRYPGGRRVQRMPDKSFPQSGNLDDTSLYRSDRLAPGDTRPVHHPEGEKDVQAIEAIGGIAVTCPQGASKGENKNLSRYDWSVLAGRTVIVLADKDESKVGLIHAKKIAELCRPIAASVTIMEAAAGCHDAADHVAAGFGLDDFVPVDDDETGYTRDDSDVDDGAALCDELEAWFGRYIAATDAADLSILTLWAAHTHLVRELYTTPRLLIDSIVPESGKTTVLEHLDRLACRALMATAVSSPALIPRLLDSGMRTLLIDEYQRSLRPDKPGVEDLLSILNTGYKVGGTRPVLVPDGHGGWDSQEMSTFCPVVMAGVTPNLPPTPCRGPSGSA